MDDAPGGCTGSIYNVIMKKTRIFRICDKYHSGLMLFSGYRIYHVQIRITFKWKTIATYRDMEGALNMVTALMKSQL